MGVRAIATRKTKFLLLYPDSGTTAAIVSFAQLVTGITTPTASISTSDGTTFDDSVDVLVQTGTDPGQYVFNLLDTDDSNLAAMQDLLESRGTRGRLLIAAPNGTFAAPTTPTNTSGVVGWTLPAGPYAFSFTEQEVEIQNMDLQLANKELWRENLTMKAIGPLIRYKKGASAGV